MPSVIKFTYFETDDTPSLEDLNALAKKLGLNLDGLISRSLVLYYEEAERSLFKKSNLEALDYASKDKTSKTLLDETH